MNKCSNLSIKIYVNAELFLSSVDDLITSPRLNTCVQYVKKTLALVSRI